MRLEFLVLPAVSLVFAGSALAGVALPSVNVGRSVSARAMYGEVANANVPRAEVKKESLNLEPKASSASNRRPGDVLAPKRPSENLWATPKDAPLRMPRADEFARLDDGFALPEESLDALQAPVAVERAENVKKIALRPAPPVKKVVEKIIDEEAVAKAYEAGRIAELQRIADRALAEPKTRKMVVPMENAPRPGIASVRSAKSSPMVEEEFAYKDELPLTKLSPMELKRAFKKTYISENKHLSAYKVEDKFDAVSDGDFSTEIQGFDSSRDLSEKSDIRPLEIKIGFRGDSAALSRDSYMLLSEYAGIVVSNPKRAVQVSIPEHAARSFDGRKLAAKRLAIIEQVLRDTGVSDQKIVPVLSDRDDDSLVLRMISNDVFQSLTQKRGKKTTTLKSLSW